MSYHANKLLSYSAHREKTPMKTIQSVATTQTVII